MDIGAWGCCRGRQRLQVEEDVTPYSLCDGRAPSAWARARRAGVHDCTRMERRAASHEM